MAKIVKINVAYVYDNKDQNIAFDIKLPNTFMDVYSGVIRNRYLKKYFRDELKKTYQSLRRLDVLEVQENDEHPAFVGKFILDFSEDDLQDFAVNYNLINIPLRENGTIKEKREKAVFEYATKILKIDILDTIELGLVDPKTQERSINYAALRNDPKLVELFSPVDYTTIIKKEEITSNYIENRSSIFKDENVQNFIEKVNKISNDEDKKETKKDKKNKELQDSNIGGETIE
jgi:hypothetical protein